VREAIDHVSNREGGGERLTERRGVSSDELRSVAMFADLSEEELEWIAATSERVELEPGDVLFSLGDPATWMYIGLSGVVEARREQLGPNAPVFVLRAGDVSGVIPFSRMTAFSGTGRAVTPVVLARFPRVCFPELLRRVPSLTPRFVSAIADRVRDATRRDAQFEKLTALGKLSAGLAHEMNNPTAAVLRTMSDARARIAERGTLTAELIRSGIDAESVLRLDALRQDASDRADRLRADDARPTPEDLLAQSDQSEALAQWLSEIGMQDPWISAPTFTDAGLDRSMLSGALEGVPPSAWPTALRWLAVGLAANALFAEAESAGRRIVHLLDAMRTYTHRDRIRDLTDVDIREGLESALSLVSGRARERGVTLVHDCAAELPRIHAYPGELNQAWINLLDNALDAAPQGTGRVVVRSALEDGAIVVEVRDNGPGIPPELQDRVFEPFFTTKDVGQGTGLGLDIVRRVVADLHGGQVSLASTPGDTRFLVRLPLTMTTTFGA
jgi:signal transduction histidine kinase